MVNNFETWDVKLQWVVEYPSRLTPGVGGTGGGGQFKIYGTNRDSESIARNLYKISSLEKYGQGWGHGIPDFSITIYEKENGPSFDVMRHLSATETPFDLRLQLLDPEPGTGQRYPGYEWMDGYEEWL